MDSGLLRETSDESSIVEEAVASRRSLRVCRRHHNQRGPRNERLPLAHFLCVQFGISFVGQIQIAGRDRRQVVTPAQIHRHHIESHTVERILIRHASSSCSTSMEQQSQVYHAALIRLCPVAGKRNNGFTLLSVNCKHSPDCSFVSLLHDGHNFCDFDGLPPAFPDEFVLHANVVIYRLILNVLTVLDACVSVLSKLDPSGSITRLPFFPLEGSFFPVLFYFSAANEGPGGLVET